tara:strand:+ start:169 stop:543 length:375 start_codon:yes stop_codon:yes gene_type:complete
MTTCSTIGSDVVRGTAMARNFGFADGTVLTGWTCAAQLRYSSNRELIADLPSVTELNPEYVNDKGETIPANTEFVVRLTGAQMTVGDNSSNIDCNLGAQLTSPDETQNPEGSTTITITPEWVYS